MTKKTEKPVSKDIKKSPENDKNTTVPDKGTDSLSGESKKQTVKSQADQKTEPKGEVGPLPKIKKTSSDIKESSSNVKGIAGTSKAQASSEPLKSQASDQKKPAKPVKKPKKTNWALRLLLLLIFFIGGSAAALYFLPQIEQRLPIVSEWLQKSPQTTISGSQNNNDASVIADLTRKIEEQEQAVTLLNEKLQDQSRKIQSVSDIVASNSQKMGSLVIASAGSTEPTDSGLSAATPNVETFTSGATPQAGMSEAEIDAKITALGNKLDARLNESLHLALTEKLNANLEESLNPRFDGIDTRFDGIDKHLTTEVATLAQRLSEEEKNSETSHAQTARIDMLYNRIGTLESAFVPLSRGLTDATDAKRERDLITQQSAAQAATITGLANRLGKVEHFAARDANGSLIQVRLASLSSQIVSGEKFGTEFDHFEALTSHGTLAKSSDFINSLNWLRLHKDQGIASHFDLKSKFDHLIPALLNAKPADPNAAWYQNLWQKTRSLVSVRKTDSVTEVDGIIRLIEYSLKDGNIKKAIAATEKLSPEGRDILDNWMKDATQNLEATATLNILKKITQETSFLGAKASTTPDQGGANL